MVDLHSYKKVWFLSLQVSDEITVLYYVVYIVDKVTQEKLAVNLFFECKRLLWSFFSVTVVTIPESEFSQI